jgi:hypothetical protein
MMSLRKESKVHPATTPRAMMMGEPTHDDSDEKAYEKIVGRMMVNNQERIWALKIKNAVERDPSLENLSDFEYVHHAIVAKDNIHKALVRIKDMQLFKERFGIIGDGNPTQGWMMIDALMGAQPDFILSVGEDREGRSIQVCDYSAFRPKLLATNAMQNFVGFYYTFHALQCDFASIREGVVWIANCKGMGLKNAFGGIWQRGSEFRRAPYPMRMKKIAMLDPPRLVHSMYYAMKPFLSKKVKDVIVMKTQQEFLLDDVIYGNTIPVHALPRSMQGTCSEKEMIQRLKDGVKERYLHSQTFRLT